MRPQQRLSKKVEVQNFEEAEKPNDYILNIPGGFCRFSFFYAYRFRDADDIKAIQNFSLCGDIFKRAKWPILEGFGAVFVDSDAIFAQKNPVFVGQNFQQKRNKNETLMKQVGLKWSNAFGFAFLEESGL